MAYTKEFDLPKGASLEALVKKGICEIGQTSLKTSKTMLRSCLSIQLLTDPSGSLLPGSALVPSSRDRKGENVNMLLHCLKDLFIGSQQIEGFGAFIGGTREWRR